MSKIGGVVVVYEGAAMGFGWMLTRLGDSPRGPVPPGPAAL